MSECLFRPGVFHNIGWVLLRMSTMSQPYVIVNLREGCAHQNTHMRCCQSGHSFPSLLSTALRRSNATMVFFTGRAMPNIICVILQLTPLKDLVGVVALTDAHMYLYRYYSSDVRIAVFTSSRIREPRATFVSALYISNSSFMCACCM